MVDNVRDYIIENKVYESCSNGYKVLIIDYTESDLEYDCLAVFSKEGIKGNIIAHEAFHIAALCLRTRGVSLSDSSEEAYAYLIDYLFKVLTLNLIKLKQEKNGNTDTSKEV